MTVDLSQFIPSFLEESFEGLELMESGLLDLELGDNETIHSIFRAAHSIKGGAGTFGFDNVTEFTHLVETLLDEMRNGQREIHSKDTEILLESVDCIRLLIEAARDEQDYDHDKIAQTSKRLTDTLGEAQLIDDADSTNSVVKCQSCGYTITFIPSHSLAQTGNDPIFLFSALAELGELTVCANTDDLPALMDIDAQELYLSWQLTLITDADKAEVIEIFEWVEDECVLTIDSLPNIVDEAPIQTLIITESSNIETDIESDKTEVSEQKNSPDAIINQPLSTSTKAIVVKQPDNDDKKKIVKNKGKADLGSIRVGVDKVDNLINLVGELVITQSMLSELGNDFDMANVERLTSGLEQLLQNTKELQESVMRIRMLPISFAFNRFPRLVHDLAIKTGKAMELVIKGEQTELDKTVMEQIGDPLVHLVRNAADHGIESSDIRVANGKPEKGTIALDAYHQGGNIVIEIHDDGAGIDTKKVLEKAIDKGLIDANATLTDSQIYDLLFEPGFSTAAAVTDISGRGVGMDVVKRNIQALGGRIQVESTLGKGSTFRVNLPLTLAILDGQLVKVGTETYIIPLLSIVESLQVDNNLVNHVSGDMVLYRLRDDNVPILPIYKLFNLEAQCTEINNALMVVVEADGQKIGLMVDDLLAQQQVVVKSLKDNYQHVGGISGATILGDGSVAMILDIPGMINMALEQAQKAQRLNNTGNSSLVAENYA